MAPRRKRTRRLRSKREEQNNHDQITNKTPFQHDNTGPQDGSWRLLRQSHSAEEVIVYKPKRLSGIASRPGHGWESEAKAEKPWVDARWVQTDYAKSFDESFTRERGKYEEERGRTFCPPYPQMEEHGGVPLSSTHVNIWPTASSGNNEGAPPSNTKKEFPEEDGRSGDGKPASGHQSVTVSTMYQQLNIVVNSNNHKGRTDITGNHVHVQTRDYHSHALADNKWLRSVKTSRPPPPSFRRGIHKSRPNMTDSAPPRSGQLVDRHREHLFSSLPTPQMPELLIPEPTEEYLRLSDPGNNKELPSPYQPILIVLDLNGALVARSKMLKASQASKCPIYRPGLTRFLEYLFQYFYVMVWSSAQPRNVEAMVNVIFSPEQKSKLLAIWARDTLGLSPMQINRKVVVYKNLDRIWRKEHRISYPSNHERLSIGMTSTGEQKGEDEEEEGSGVCHFYPHKQKQRWSQFNTVLIDDSAIKAKNQPYNHIEVSEWDDPAAQKDDVVLLNIIGYLEELRGQSNVSAFIHKTPFR